MKPLTSNELALKIYEWLSIQTYDGELVLHAPFYRDPVYKARFIEALKDIIDGGH